MKKNYEDIRIDINELLKQLAQVDEEEGKELTEEEAAIIGMYNAIKAVYMPM
jgi:hypothetical protein